MTHPEAKDRDSTAQAQGFDAKSAEEALRKMEGKISAIAAHQVQPFRAPAAQVVANAVRVARAYAEDRGRIAATFRPEAFRPEEYDDLVLRAQALWQADLELRRVIDPKGVSQDLIGAAEPLRQRLLRAAVYLWQNDVELGDQVADIREGQGYLDLADDLAALAGLFGAHWEYARTRADIREDDLQAARDLSAKLVDALVSKAVARENAERGIARLRDVRDRAAAYAREGVETVRAAAAFVYRSQPEALDRYPAFFSGVRGPKQRRRDEEPATAAAAPQPT